MYPGITIKIDGTDYIVPALSLGQLRRTGLAKIREHDELIAADKTFDAVVLRGDVIVLALQRNYPDISPDRVMDWLDMSNSQQIWLAVLGASGYLPGEQTAAEKTTMVENEANLTVSSPSIAA